MRMARPARRAARFACVAAGALALAACAGQQSALYPDGPGARDAALLFWVMTAGGAAILAAVVGLLLYAVLWPHDRRWQPDPLRLVLAGGGLLPVVTLSGLLAFSAGKGASSYAAVADDAHRVRVVARQWWWELEYLDGDRRLAFTTANELRIPAGEPVELVLTSGDVIHSLWIPRLAGKIDLIPGQTNRLVVQADGPGVYRGQCAEFCGIAHAQMALYVVSLPPDDYRAWVARQKAPAPEPSPGLAKAGAVAFATRGCILCHTVRGHDAHGRSGPDLTHVGTRRTIGAGVLRTTPENVAHWIAQNHEIKPGNRMPSFVELDGTTRLAIGTYLAGLE